MRTDLYRDPKVIQMTDLLAKKHNVTVTLRNVMRNAVVGALTSIWGVVRHQGHREGDDLKLKNATPKLLDDIADLPGIGNAMAEVGWVHPNGLSLVFPRFFEEHNSDPLEVQRQKNRERQQRYRATKKEGESRNVERNVTRNVTVTLPSTLLFSYSFLLSNKEIGLPENLRTPQFEEAWDAWVKHRVEIKKKLTATSVGRQLRKFSDWGPARASTALLYTIEKGWQGVREPENGSTANAGSGDQRGDAMSRDEVRRQSRRAAIVKAGRKAGLNEAEIEGQLQAEGLEL